MSTPSAIPGGNGGRDDSYPLQTFSPPSSPPALIEDDIKKATERYKTASKINNTVFDGSEPSSIYQFNTKPDERSGLKSCSIDDGQEVGSTTSGVAFVANEVFGSGLDSSYRSGFKEEKENDNGGVGGDFGLSRLFELELSDENITGSGIDADVDADDLPFQDTHEGPVSPDVLQVQPQVAPLAQPVAPDAVAPAAPAQAALADLDPAEIDKIKEYGVNQAPGDQSSQNILAKMKEDLEKLGYNKIQIKAVLAKDPTDGGKFALEAYNDPSNPKETYYRIGVTYRISVEEEEVPANADGGEPAKKLPQETFQFERTISTSSTNPEDALTLAMQFKKQVCKHARMSKDELAALSEEQKAARNARSFTFNFSRNSLGAMTHLQSIKFLSGAGKATKRVEIAAPPPPKNALRFTYVDNAPWMLKDDEGLAPGQLVFDTKEQAIIYGKKFKIQQKAEDILKDGETAQQFVSQLKEDIQKKQTEFEQVKASFIKRQGLLNFFGTSKKTETDEFLTFARSARVFSSLQTEGAAIDAKELQLCTPAVQEYQKLKNEITADLAPADRGAKEKKLKEKGGEIIKEFASFNQELAKLARINRDLDAKLGQIKALSLSATVAAAKTGVPEEESKKANQIADSITNLKKDLQKKVDGQTAALGQIWEVLIPEFRTGPGVSSFGDFTVGD